MNTRSCLIAVGLPLLLATCERDPSPDASVSSAVQDSLRLTITAPLRVRPGERVPIVLQVANVSGRPLELYLRGRNPTADITVRDAGSAVVWQNLEGVVVPAILSLRQLPAGESLTLRVTWDQRTAAGAPARPGRFRIEAALLTEHGHSLAFPPALLDIAGPGEL